MSNAKRKYTEADLQKGKKACLQGFEAVAGVETADVDGILRQLHTEENQTGAANASLQREGAVEVQLQAMRNGPDVGNNEVDADDDDDGDDSVAGKKKKKTSALEDESEEEPWFDAEAGRSALVRTWRSVTQDLSKQLTTVRDELIEHAHFSPAAGLADHFKISIELVNSRLVPIEAALHEKPEDMLKYISDVFESKIAAACKDVTKLVTINALKGMQAAVEKVASQAELEGYKSTLEEKRRSLQLLVKAGKAASADFLAVEKCLVKEKEQAEKAAKKAATAAASGGKKGRPSKAAGSAVACGVQELGEGVAQAFVELPNGTSPDLCLPCVVMNSEVSKALYKPTHPIHLESVNRFAKAYEKSDLRLTAGRAARLVYDESLHERCTMMFHKVAGLSDAFPLSELEHLPALKSAVTTHHCAMSKGTVSTAYESEYLPCIRVAFTGKPTQTTNEKSK